VQNLKSAEEMEEEEKAYHSAKLQELIRRGTPRDLQEANKLMKVMAGYDQRNKTDYRAKAAEEVAKVQQKAKILEEMLQSYKPGDEIQEGDVMEVSFLECSAWWLRVCSCGTGTLERACERPPQNPEDVRGRIR